MKPLILSLLLCSCQSPQGAVIQVLREKSGDEAVRIPTRILVVTRERHRFTSLNP